MIFPHVLNSRKVQRISVSKSYKLLREIMYQPLVSSFWSFLARSTNLCRRVNKQYESYHKINHAIQNHDDLVHDYWALGYLVNFLSFCSISSYSIHSWVFKCPWSNREGYWLNSTNVQRNQNTNNCRQGANETWWRHQVENFSALLAHCVGNISSHPWIPCTEASDVERWCVRCSAPE